MNWIKYFFFSPKFFELDNKKQYELHELIQILKNEKISIGMANAIILKIIDELVKKHEE